MKTKKEMIDALIKREGGFANHKNDRGGPTRYGVTEATARAHGYNGSMKSLPKATAERIYSERYWDALGLDEIYDLAPRLAEEIFDTAVNMGTNIAAMFLQQALNVLGVRKLVEDAVLGPKTLAALRAFLKARGGIGEWILLKLLDAYQAVRYAQLVKRDPKQRDFIVGWLAHRVGNTAQNA